MPAGHPLSLPRALRLAVLPLVAGLVLAVAPLTASAAAATTVYFGPSRTITAGTSATMTTRVVAGGSPVAYQKVTVYSRVVGGSWHYLASATTNRYGYATWRQAPRRTTYYFANFAARRGYLADHSPAITFSVRQPSSTSSSAVVTEAARHRGKPYQWGAAGPYRFDCSGFTLYVYSRFGKRLPHSSRMQYASLRHIPQSQVRPGDLVFTGSSPSTIHHVGIYAGSGRWWHSPRSGETVSLDRIYTSHYYVARVS